MQTTEYSPHGSRPPAVAGTFYPASADTLSAQISTCFAQAASSRRYAPKAIVAPHAGYVYSGPVAATAYQQLHELRETVDQVVLLGPSHRVAFQGIAACSWEAYLTPLGPVPLDLQCTGRLLESGLVTEFDQAHAQEHSLEVQLPFLQQVLEDFRLLPLVVGDADPQQVADVIEAIWDGPQTLIVISSDLSHYHPYQEARVMDHETSAAIERLDYRSIDYQQACGRAPLAGMLLAARHHRLQARTLDLRNSGDTAGDRQRVVGYGAYVFS